MHLILLSEQQRLITTSLPQAFFMQWYRYHQIAVIKSRRQRAGGKFNNRLEDIEATLRLEQQDQLTHRPGVEVE